MGNKREQLKEDIAREIKRKIEVASYLLDGLRIAQHDIKTDCEKAKHRFQSSMNELIQTLTLRNTELANKIDSLCATQINSLQESIQATYVTLGSLQSTLANLDSFDHTQLLNVVLPDCAMNVEAIQVSFLDVDTECTQLKDEIGHWGRVQSKELSTLQTGPSASAIGSNNSVGTPAQVVPSHPEHQENTGTVQAWLDKPAFILPTDDFSFDDDFEMVEPTSTKPDKLADWSYYFANENDELAAAVERGLDIHGGDNEKHVNANANSGEQKIAVATEFMGPTTTPKCTSQNEDLSKWLKPKRSTQTQAQQTAISAAAIVPEEPSQQFPSFPSSSSSSSNSSSSVSSAATTPSGFMPPKSMVVPSKRQYLDFPCLRLDPNCWLATKRMKDAKTLGHTLCSDVCFNLSQKEIIPPSYALPYPFWLKK